MRKTKIIVGILILILVASFLLNLTDLIDGKSIPVNIVSIPEKNEPNPYVKDLLTSYETTIQELQTKTKTPGVAIAIVSDTAVIYLKGFGVREAGKKDSVNIHTIFRLASVSKCFAPVLTGLLVEDGILSWNDPITRYIPGFALQSKEYTDSLTIRHVLSHTTGLPYHTYTTLVEDGLDLKTMISKLGEVKLTNKPGEIYSYQNVAFSLIAEVIQSATGKSYEELMAEKVFKPLNMKDASMTYSQIIESTNVAKPHLLHRKGWKATAIKNTYYNVSPAGGVNASIADMAEWLKALLGSKTDFIENKTLEEIFTPTVKARSKNRNFRRWVEPANSYYALGWRVLNFKKDTLLYHGGYINGYRSEIALNRKNKIGICVLSNAPGSLIDNSVPYFFHLYFNQRTAILDWEQQQAEMARKSKMIKR